MTVAFLISPATPPVLGVAVMVGAAEAVVDAFTDPLALLAVTTNVHGPPPTVTGAEYGEVIPVPDVVVADPLVIV